MAGEYPGYEVFAIGHDNGTTYSSKTFRAKNENKRNGSYERFTAKNKKVTHEPFVDRSGREGYKDEQITTSSYKCGDKNGYTGYSFEEKVKRVNYDTSNNNDSNAKSSYPKCHNYKRVKWSHPKCNNYKKVKWSYKE